jgi:L-ascorbate metabolism protein UlaG (beta-lactamase superfamily)
MDLQYHGANCIVASYKGARIVIDDNLAKLGAKGVIKADDVALFTNQPDAETNARLTFSSPGEYEVSDISIIGIPARAHMDEEKTHNATIYKLVVGDLSVLFTGHIYPELDENQLEAIGMVDVMVVPVGGNGYTLDPVGALKLIKDIEPKMIIPTHYADKSLKYEMPQQELTVALKELGMEPKEKVAKLKLKHGDIDEVMHLVVLEKA